MVGSQPISVRRDLRSIGALFVAIALVTAHVARASPPSPEEAEAISVYKQGSVAYAEGRFTDAANLLLKAYALKHEPVILFNLARAYEGAGNLSGAVDAYRRYLDSVPNASDRLSVEQRVATLRKQIQERAELERQRDEERARAEIERRNLEALKLRDARRRSRQSPLPWVVAGVGLAGVGVAFVFGGLSQGAYNSAVGEPFIAPANRDYSNAVDFANVANVAFVVGGVVAAAGIVWEIVQLASNAKESTSVGVSFGPCGVRVVGSF